MESRVLDWYKSTLPSSWYRELEPFLLSDDMENIRKTTLEERKLRPIFPEANKMFSAFLLTPFDEVRVVIIGQDPYHTPGYATGLAFSSGKEYPLPPSLRNILTEVENDVYNGLDLQKPLKFNLESWAKQGVLLINTALTVPQGAPGKHAELWKPFTEYVIKCLQVTPGIIYVLWGAHAQSFKPLINEKLNFILEAPHPSPFSAYKGFFGCKHFSKINEIIEYQTGKEFLIKW